MLPPAAVAPCYNRANPLCNVPTGLHRCFLHHHQLPAAAKLGAAPALALQVLLPSARAGFSSAVSKQRGFPTT